MKHRQLFLFLLLLTATASYCRGQAIRVLVVTGGHDYNKPEFENMLDSLPGAISYKISELPDAFTMFEKQHRNEYDVLVFYHMWQKISAGKQDELAECIREGKPLVVLHHSICAFDDWNEYINIIGGKYFHRQDTVDGILMQPSSYRHDVPVSIHMVRKNHPVTKGLSDFTLFDETYDHFYVQPNVTALLLTDTPGSTKIIGWTKKYGRSRVVTFQTGHDIPAYRSDWYRQLLWQAISWSAGSRQK